MPKRQCKHCDIEYTGLNHHCDIHDLKNRIHVLKSDKEYLTRRLQVSNDLLHKEITK